MEEEISVVILTKNEERNIGKCLFYLSKQTLKPLEIIVVDANSSDNTVNIARSYNARIIKENKRKGGFGYARNLGIRVSKGSLILFLDADIYLKDTEILSKALKRFREFEADALLAKVCFPNTPLGIYLSKCFGDKLGTRWGEYTPHNRFVLIKKSVLEEIGGYDETFREGGEDLDCFYRLHLAGKKVIYDPEIKVFHNAGYSLEEWKKKAYRDGFSFAKFTKKHGIKRNGIITRKFYPFLASLYAGVYCLSKIGIKGSQCFVINYILAKERQRGYLDGLRSDTK